MISYQSKRPLVFRVATFPAKYMILGSMAAILGTLALLAAVPDGPACYTERWISSEVDYREARTYSAAGNVMSSLNAREQIDETTRKLIRESGKAICSEVSTPPGH